MFYQNVNTIDFFVYSYNFQIERDRTGIDTTGNPWGEVSVFDARL